MQIWITGAGSGIGKALALRYAAGGHTVVVSGRTLDKLNAVRDEAEPLAGRIIPMTYDVSDDDVTKTSSDLLAGLTPHLDLVIMNAGACEYIKGQTLEPAMFRRVMDANFFGMINTTNVAMPLLRKAPHRPVLAGVCSLAGFIGFPRAEAYAASKAASRYLMHSLRIDFSDVVDVCAINPGFVETPMTERNDFPMPFLMTADDAAARIQHGLKHRPRELNFPRRLTFMLRLAQLSGGLWYALMSRQRQKERREREKSRKKPA
ncbi:SDR family NAD(P)-dependent oxidoreductase [Pseudohongiella sp.]|uniref:Short-chain dehydrogenase/reductase SDR n=1 Tax=marine sediment metagenome TaxID=412755 RepID=A0A0F9WHM6_9ZZZZ|nr:SDR family NAD(P)-dependent oxidoreductase [Pseudohongiella sp.]HDZ07874.1 SDR family NAD(P)-dependent oxidoreductase [Pseudohongiella sp.]HEA61794.1 SDR family NAD(P)-dependent oxidoreductase [Pseudohongiella sp.]